MAQKIKLLRRKISTAFRLLQHGEFERVQTIVTTELDKKFPSLANKKNTPDSGVTKGQQFDPLATKSRKPIPRHSLQQIEKPTVAVVMDEFSETAWSHEFDLINLSSDDWLKSIENKKIDFLFVESAWRGKHDSWKGKLNQGKETSPELRELLAYCSQSEIPSVFWNKEDPPFFEEFHGTASLFDFVFTTDSDCIARYKRSNPNQTVELLPFAAQPAIHNPARNLPETAGFPRKRIHSGGIAFAGTFFADKFPNRKAQIEMLLTGARDAAKRLDVRFTIYSRMGTRDARYRFPDAFTPYVAGSLPYSKMLSAFQEHILFLNVNTVTESPTMCARRLFEIPASGTQVVTTAAKAIRNFFPTGTVPIVTSDLDATDTLLSFLRSPLIRDKSLHRTQRVIWNHHTYKHRANKILQTIGLSDSFAIDSGHKPQISIICSTIRPDNLPHLLKQIGRQKNVEIELILGAHGFEVNKNELRAIAAMNGIPFRNIRVFDIPDSLSLGASLNTLVSHTQHSLVTKMDDDDTYLPHYLEDLANALSFSGADLVGKQAVYAHLGNDEIIIRNPEREHIFTHFVIGPTLFGYRETFLNNPFEDRTHGEDTQFLKAIIANGGRIYSADRFNFVQQRAGSHTWDQTDLKFLAEGRLETWGDGESHAEA